MVYITSFFLYPSVPQSFCLFICLSLSFYLSLNLSVRRSVCLCLSVSLTRSFPPTPPTFVVERLYDGNNSGFGIDAESVVFVAGDQGITDLRVLTSILRRGQNAQDRSADASIFRYRLRILREEEEKQVLILWDGEEEEEKSPNTVSDKRERNSRVSGYSDKG